MENASVKMRRNTSGRADTCVAITIRPPPRYSATFSG